MPKYTISPEHFVAFLKEDQDYPINSFISSCASITKLTKTEESTLKEHCKKQHLKERYLMKHTAIKTSKGLPGLIVQVAHIIKSL